jgi:hypothetical protein
MSTKSKLALIAALTTLIAAPAFAFDPQASTEAGNRVQVGISSGAYASAQKAPRATRSTVRPAAQLHTQTEDFQAVGSH